jgi:hypothetical protein
VLTEKFCLVGRDAKQALLSACLVYTATVKIKAVHSSKMSVNFYQTTQYHIPENSTFHVLTYPGDQIL